MKIVRILRIVRFHCKSWNRPTDNFWLIAFFIYVHCTLAMWFHYKFKYCSIRSHPTGSTVVESRESSGSFTSTCTCTPNSEHPVQYFLCTSSPLNVNRTQSTFTAPPATFETLNTAFIVISQWIILLPVPPVPYTQEKSGLHKEKVHQWKKMIKLMSHAPSSKALCGSDIFHFIQVRWYLYLTFVLIYSFLSWFWFSILNWVDEEWGLLLDNLTWACKMCRL